MTGTIFGSAALTAGQVATTSAASNTVRIRSILPLFAAAEREKFHEDSSGYFRQSGHSINCNLAWRVGKSRVGPVAERIGEIIWRTVWIHTRPAPPPISEKRWSHKSGSGHACGDP